MILPYDTRTLNWGTCLLGHFSFRRLLSITINRSQYTCLRVVILQTIILLRIDIGKDGVWLVTEFLLMISRVQALMIIYFCWGMDNLVANQIFMTLADSLRILVFQLLWFLWRRYYDIWLIEGYRLSLLNLVTWVLIRHLNLLLLWNLLNLLWNWRSTSCLVPMLTTLYCVISCRCYNRSHLVMIILER